MKIAYLGNFRPTYSTETHIAATLESMGFDVVRLQENEQTAPLVLERTLGCGAAMLLWTRTWRTEGDWTDALRRLREARVPSVAYHLDLYAPIGRGLSSGYDGRGVRTDPWWRCEHVFSADGGSDPFWLEHGITHHYMPPAVYHGECGMSEPRRGSEVDVAFVGSYDYHSEWPYRPQLIDWLSREYGPRFRLVPGRAGEAVRGAALNQLYADARVVVGDSLCPGFTHRDYTSDRLFETLGRGGFLIYPRIAGVTDGTLVTEGEHVACYSFGDFAELRAKIDYYLAHPDERERIRRAGHAHVVAGHTYRHRLAAMLETVLGRSASA